VQPPLTPPSTPIELEETAETEEFIAQSASLVITDKENNTDGIVKDLPRNEDNFDAANVSFNLNDV